MVKKEVKMKFNILEYSKLLAKYNISMIYSGPLWAEGIDGMAEFLQKRLDMDDMPLSESQAVFSVFVEQMNNMLMYSVEKEKHEHPEAETSSGIFVLGTCDKSYYVQTGNVIRDSSVGLLKERIDFLNTLDKKELRQFYKEQMKAENDNPESKGAGLGLTEIAKRATSKIEYEFIPYGEGLSYFTMYVTV
jgi:hypothetical protein